MKTLAKPEQFRIVSPYIYGYEAEDETNDDGTPLVGSSWVWQDTVRVKSNGVVYTLTVNECQEEEGHTLHCTPVGSLEFVWSW